MGTWKSSGHTINDFNDWSIDNKLIIQPSFQRMSVWNRTSKIMLIDTILKAYPIPKIFIQNVKNEDGVTKRKIIDGQQRITAILEFVNNKFSLDEPYEGEFLGKFYKDLPQDTIDHIDQYLIDCNEAYGYSEEQYREIYTRLNKYTVPLNSQELRKAEFPGAFYQLSENIAALPILEDRKIFTVATRRRLLDVEFISEILAALLEGPQEKKESLDDFYRKYNSADLSNLEDRFSKILKEIEILFHKNSISKTRFKQKSDFYSLIIAIDFFTQQNLSLANISQISALINDFILLDESISPSEDTHKIFQEYAIRCVTSANSSYSRKWRADFLKIVLSGTYYNFDKFHSFLNDQKKSIDEENFKLYISFYSSLDPRNYELFGEVAGLECSICEEAIDSKKDNRLFVMNKSNPFQASNLKTIDEKCYHPDAYIKIDEFLSSFNLSSELNDEHLKNLFGDFEE